MEVLKKLGLTDDQIEKLTNGTDEEKDLIVEDFKKSIIEPVINDPEARIKIVNDTKLEITKIIQKKIAKDLGVQIEKDDDITTILEKGKKSLISNSELSAREMQEKYLTAQAEIKKYEDEVIPGIRNEEQSKIKNVFIDMEIQKTASKLDKSIMNIDDRVVLGKTKIQSLGLALDFDDTTKQVIIKHKETGLKPTIAGKTFELNDLDGIFSTLLEPYNQKSNGGNQGGNGTPPPNAGVPPVGLNSVAQRLLNDTKK